VRIKDPDVGEDLGAGEQMEVKSADGSLHHHQVKIS
jgi:hypothetical protein